MTRRMQDTRTKGTYVSTSTTDAAGLKDRRRLTLLKRSGLFGSDLHGAVITRACNVEELQQAYRLVYEAYVAAGYIRPNEWGIRIRAFEACAETATFVAKTPQGVVGTLSLVIDSPDLGLPCDVCFRRELDRLRAKGLRLSETTNQAVASAFRRTAVTTELMRCAAAQNWLERRDLNLAVVSPAHRGFYALLGFRELSGVRSYSDVVHDPVILMGLDMNRIRRPDESLSWALSSVRSWLSFTNPYVGKVLAWQKAARRRFYDPGLLRRLFVEQGDVLGSWSDSQRQAIRRRWGRKLFAEVSRARNVASQPAGRYVADDSSSVLA